MLIFREKQELLVRVLQAIPAFLPQTTLCFWVLKVVAKK